MNTSKQSRGKVPDYPRPVPYIDVDEIPICDDTIVYEHRTSAVEQEAEERAKKRRKTRLDIAESYLRGVEIKILTASLKGPFEGWKNPWAKRPQRKRNQNRLDVPETTLRRIRTEQPSSLRVDLSNPIDIDNNHTTPADAVPSNIDPANPFNAKLPNMKPVLEAQEPSSMKRVEDWLRTGNSLSRRPISHVCSSPTPLSRPASRQQIPPRPRSDPSRGTIADQEPTGLNEQDPLKITTVIPSPSGTASSAPTHESPRRAEAAILAHKRGSVQQIPPSTNLPALEFWRGRRNGKHGGEKQQCSISAAGKDLQAPELRPKPYAGPESDHIASDKLTSRPTLSAETSKTSTVQNLPSAQIAPAARLEAGISNAHSTEDMLQELPSTTRSELQKDQNGRALQDVLQLTAKAKEQLEVKIDERDQEYSEEVDVTSLKAMNVHNLTPARESETQQVIAAIKPFEFSSVKKLKQTLSKLQSPVTTQKAMSVKSTKRASFAVDQPPTDGSQPSIKQGLKITKMMTSAATDKPSMKISLFPEAKTNSCNGEEENHHHTGNESLPSVSSKFGTKKGSAPKSILKSSNALSSGVVGSGGTTSTSMKQDAQIPIDEAEHNALQYDLMADDDCFDVDAAINELGSYLGTWDPEEEAAKMTMAN